MTARQATPQRWRYAIFIAVSVIALVSICWLDGTFVRGKQPLEIPTEVTR